jgi:type IV secretion system protein VirD4
MRLISKRSISLRMRIAMVREQLTKKIFPEEKGLYHNRFAENHELEPILGLDLDGEYLLLGIGEYKHLLRVESTRERRELGNILVVGRTRCGKGLLGKPQMLTWMQSVIANDIKGEYSPTLDFRLKNGPAFFFNPTGVGHGYDPFRGKFTEDELRNAATNILFRPDEGENAVFTLGAITMLTQLFLAAREEEKPILPYVRHLLYSGPIDAAKRLNDISVAQNRFPNLATRFLGISLADMQRKHFDDRTFMSFWYTLTHRMEPLLTSGILKSISRSDFTAEDIIAGEKPATVYLQWPEHALLSLAPLIRLVWCSLIDEMIKIYDGFRKVGQQAKCRKVLLLIDEAGRTAIPMLSEYCSTVVERGMSIWMAIQSLSQLEAVYGLQRADTILNNTDTKIFYRPATGNVKAADQIRMALGDVSRYAESQTLRDGEETSMGRSERAVPLLSAQEILQMEDDEVIIYYANKAPIRAKRMDIRRFPKLQARMSEIPPEIPTLPSLQDIVLEPLSMEISGLQKGRGESDPGFVDPELFLQ